MQHCEMCGTPLVPARAERSPFDLVYCAGGNERLTTIAAQAGFLPGIQAGRSSHGFPVYFVDLDYKRPNWSKHLKAVARYRPRYATVPDLSDTEVSAQDVARALRQYDKLARHCDVPLLIPKLPGQFALIPPGIALGYSVPTRYGGISKDVRYWHFEGRRVHLLGGSPQQQLAIYRGLSLGADVRSADGNMAQLLAMQFAKYWEAGDWTAHPQRGTNTPDIYLECFRWSCANIYEAWSHHVDLQPAQLSFF